MRYLFQSVALTTFLLLFGVLDAQVFATEQLKAVGEQQTVVSSEKVQSHDEEKLPSAKGAFLSRWLRMLDQQKAGESAAVGVMSFAPRAPGDIAAVLKRSGGERGGWGVLLAAILSLVSIAVGYLGRSLVRKSMQGRIDKVQSIAPVDDAPMSRFWIAVLHNIPDFIGLLVLGVTATICFLLLSTSLATDCRMIFQLLLGTLLTAKFGVICCNILFSPDNANTRLVKVQDSLLKPLSKILWSTVTVFVGGVLTVLFFRELGVQEQTISWLLILIGTLAILVIGYQLVAMRQPVADAIDGVDDFSNEKPVLKAQLADYWHLPALFYLLLCWFVWVGQELTGTALRNGALIASVMVVPLYFCISYFGKVIIHSVVSSLNLFAEVEPEIWEQAAAQGVQIEVERKPPEVKTEELAARVCKFFRVFLAIGLGSWLLNLWGYSIPYANGAVKAIFQSLVTVGLALVCWKYVSVYIERKIEEATPEEDEKKADSDDEFGGAAPRGRSHTLLPMLRKVVGSVLLLVVVLTVISSFGVNIGPLLAGAGVLGLAIGFGAQKLVSDVLSGFFFLLDDAFRVGEYIQAGSIKGTVEAITLRNVLLRHHLGMLQVVPHSDLGAITNYMRGGIVVRFPLEFPYDTDVDKVRKIIKKVGQAMLNDPELGDDFILPVKSQGVNEIANSVMVIRVKFTAKPGKQFLIRREAYRRITEALNAKGIYYAHRKVIVDFPDDSPVPGVSEEARKKALEAGAAAAVTVENETQLK